MTRTSWWRLALKTLNTSLRPSAGRRLAARLAFTLSIIGVGLWFSAAQLSAIDATAVWRSLADLSWPQWLGALGATMVAMFAAAQQERAIVGHLGLAPEPRRAQAAALATASISQTVGFGPFVGAIVRRRLLPNLTITQSFSISLGITLAFFAGLGLFGLACMAFVPGMPMADLAQSLLAVLAILVAAYVLLPMRRAFGFRFPGMLTVQRLVFWVGIDLLALGVAFWVLLPSAASPPLMAVLPVFLLALGIGLSSGSPAGAGPFEATLLMYLPQADQHGLVAGILAFRAVVYAGPAVCGGIWVLVAPKLLRAPAEVPLRPDADIALTALPQAEAQLIRQGELELLASDDHSFWTSGSLSGTRVFLGDPMRVLGRKACARSMISAALDVSRRETKSAFLYKIGPRTAATARTMGLMTLPVAHEAVLAPLTFVTDGPAKAGLRRKLRHAQKAGITVEAPVMLPLADLARVSARWAARNGGERGFSMGRWDAGYVTGQKVFVARDSTGEVVAFVTFHATSAEWVLDLVRYGDGLPDGTLYALIHEAIRAAARCKVPRLTLAAVPHKTFGLPLWVQRAGRRVLRRMRGLEQFKATFAPVWEPRYIAAKGPMSLVAGAIATFTAVHLPT